MNINPLEKLFMLDERMRLVGMSHIRIHDELSAIELNASVPAKVRELLEIAANLSIYSAFVFEFNPIAESVSFSALEAAFRERAVADGLSEKSAHKKRLAQLLEMAKSRQWITEDKFPNRDAIAIARAREKIFIQMVRDDSEAMKAGVDLGEREVPEPTDAEISSEAASMKFVEPMLDALRQLRNGLAHGKLHFTPYSYRSIRQASNIINALFPK